MENVKQISIVITDVNKPPTVIVDGINVAVVEFEHKYHTRDACKKGSHSYLIKYLDDDVIKTIGHERLHGDME